MTQTLCVCARVCVCDSDTVICAETHDSLQMCDMTHYICVTWLSTCRGVTWLVMYVWHDSSCMCDMTQHISLCTYAYCDEWVMPRIWTVCVTWLVHMCGRTHWSDVSIAAVGVPWLIHTRAKTRSCVWHNSFVCVVWPVRLKWDTHVYEWVMSHRPNKIHKKLNTCEFVRANTNCKVAVNRIWH